MNRNRLEIPATGSVNIKTSHTTSSLRLGAIFVGLFMGFSCYAMTRFIEPLGPYLPYGIGAIAAVCFYKLRLIPIESDAYDSLDFAKDSFTVNFISKPKLKVRYKDVTRVNGPFEEQPITLTLKGNYPMLFLALHPLERGYEKKFVEFLMEEGFVS